MWSRLEPMVTLSVVIPVRNGGETLGAQLRALAEAERPPCPFEVVVADNGSTDDTAEVALTYANRFPVRVVDASRGPGTNIARNEGVAAAQGEWIVLCDADDEVDARWLVVMTSALTAGHQLVAGPIDYRRLNAPGARAWRGADRAGAVTVLDFLPAGHTANLGFTRALFDAIGGFDERFSGAGDDTEFCWRAQLAGFALHVQADAIVHYRLRGSLRDHFRQAIVYGDAEAGLYRRFADKGLRRRSLNTVGHDLWWLTTRLPFVWTRARWGAWLRRLGNEVGRIRGAVRYRVLWW